MRNKEDLWLLLVVECALATLLVIKGGASDMAAVMVGIFTGVTVLLLILIHNDRYTK